MIVFFKTVLLINYITNLYWPKFTHFVLSKEEILVQKTQTFLREKKIEWRQWALIVCVDVHLELTPSPIRMLPPESDSLPSSCGRQKWTAPKWMSNNRSTIVGYSSVQTRKRLVAKSCFTAFCNPALSSNLRSDEVGPTADQILTSRGVIGPCDIFHDKTLCSTTIALCLFLRFWHSHRKENRFYRFFYCVRNWISQKDKKLKRSSDDDSIVRSKMP